MKGTIETERLEDRKGSKRGDSSRYREQGMERVQQRQRMVTEKLTGTRGKEEDARRTNLSKLSVKRIEEEKKKKTEENSEIGSDRD